MNLPLKAVLDAARSRADQAFARGWLQQQQTQFDAQVARLQGTLATQDQATAARIADLQAAVKTVGELSEATRTAAGDLRALVETNLAESKQARTELADELTQMQTVLGAQLTTVQNQLKAFATEQAALVGTWIWVVGDPQYVAAKLPDYVVCQGQELAYDAEPDLGAVLGSTFGTPADARCFRLPTKSQLTAATVLLNAANVWPWMRRR